MNNIWIDVNKKLPPQGKYVLVHLNKDNHGDQDDPKGVYFHVAKLKMGISKGDREKMKSGELPDIDIFNIGYSMEGRFIKAGKRSDAYFEEDEKDNNKRPYKWFTFGPSIYFGQDVDYWMKIPTLNSRQK